MQDTNKRTLTFLVIPTITILIPDQTIDRSMIQMLRNLQLADPRFHGPGQIEILLSAGPTLAAQWIRQIKTNRLNDTDLRLQTLDSIRLGRRREPSRSIDIARISRNYNGFTSGSRPLLEN